MKEDNFIKNSAIIAISNKISLLQRKLFNFLVAHAFIYLKEKDTYDVKISDLKFRMGFNSKNDEYIKDALKKLLSTVVEFNLLSKDKENWSASSLLASVEFKKWICYYSFSPLLRSKLHNPTIYAKLNLNLIKLFSSKYTLCLYELVIDYIKIKQTPFIPLEIFKTLMGIDANSYNEFKRLKQRVISPALKELNTIAWFTIDMEYKKESKKIVAIKFLLHQVKLHTDIKKEKLEEKIYENQALQNILIKEYWLTLRQTNTILKTYPIAYIKESLEIIKIKRSQWVIKNLPSYTLTVLKNDYILPQYPTKWDIKEKSLLQNPWKSWKKEKNKNTWNQIDNLNLLSNDPNRSSILQDQKKAYRYFTTLSKEEQEKIVQKFEQQKITSDILKIHYKKEGIKSTLFKGLFLQYLKDYDLAK